MKQYKVFKHPSGTIEAVKQGWSWPAFFFNSFWAMAKKIWMLGVAVFIGLTIFMIIVHAAGGGKGGDAAIKIVEFILIIIFGINGNSWREKNLVSRGFEQVDAVTAANEDGAIALYLKTASSAER